jgi:hypothetical protein
MIFIDPLLLTSAALLAQASAGALCDQPAPTRINIVPKIKEIQYDYLQSMTDIQSAVDNAHSPYDMHDATITQGFANGIISVEQKLDLAQEPINNGREACLSYRAITITIEMSPKITIAREVRSDKCMHNAVLEHEKKHVKVDRQMVDLMAQSIGKTLYAALQEKGFVYGPVSSKQEAEDIYKDMASVVNGVLEDEYQKMAELRQAEQAKIDTRQEYESVAAQCPFYHKRKNYLYRRALKKQEK